MADREQTMKQRYYGIVPSPPKKKGEVQDYYSRIAGDALRVGSPEKFGTNELVLASGKLPKKFSWADQRLSSGQRMIPRVENQGQHSTCVGFGASSAAERMHAKEKDEIVNLSAWDLYQWCKERDGLPPRSGTFARIALAGLKHRGVATEQSVPYLGTIPEDTPDLIKERSNFRIDMYYRLNPKNTEAIKLAISKHGVIGAMPVGSNWNNPYIHRLVDPRGRHLVHFTGWDRPKATEYIEIEDSHGSNVGKFGYKYVDVNYIQRHCYEVWGMVDAKSIPSDHAANSWFWNDFMPVFAKLWRKLKR